MSSAPACVTTKTCCCRWRTRVPTPTAASSSSPSRQRRGSTTSTPSSARSPKAETSSRRSARRALPPRTVLRKTSSSSRSRSRRASVDEPEAAGAKADVLMPQVYDELRRLAANYIRNERPGQTLQATALVHEAFLRLSKEKNQPWKNRTHFMAIAALSMRQILVQRARARHAEKRGGKDAERITLDDSAFAQGASAGQVAEGGHGIDVLELDAALQKLAALDPQQAKIVELRYFGGLTVEEVAEALETSPATVKRHWAVARAWLHKELSSGG